MISALILLASAINPPLKGDVMAHFEVSEPGVGVYQWRPGRVTVLCAFAYWCDTWKTQRERLMATREKMTGVPVDYLAVSVDGQWMEVDKKANWSRRLIDSGSHWSSSIGIDRVPYTMVIDESGTVRWAGYGISRSDDIVHAIRESVSGATSASNTVYLTFDDFPAKSGNEELLDTLRQAEVHASLFVIGENAEREPKWTKRAAEDGNRLEVHGWRHTAQDSLPTVCRDWIAKQTGQTPRWIRGPGSSVVQDFAGHAFVANEVDPYDYLRPGKSELMRRVTGQLKGGSILHLHAGVPETVVALPEIIERGRKLGLQFQSLPN